MGKMKNGFAPWGKVITVFFTVRVLASVAALLSVSSFPSQGILSANGYTKPAYSRPMELLVGVWERADAIWYLGIAQNGYGQDPKAAAFMPFYSGMIAGLSTVLPGPPVLSALLISNLAFFFALLFLFRLTESECDSEVAERALWYQALFPGSLFFFAPYTESLFLFLATGSFLAARRGRWSLAGLLGALLGLTRNWGALIFIPLLVEWIQQFFLGRNASRSRLQVLWLLLIPMGIGLWMVYWKTKTGDEFAFLHQQSGWQREMLLPWQTFLSGMRQAWDFLGAYPGGIYALEALSVMGAVVLGVIGFFRVSLPLSLYLWMGLLPPLLAPYPGRMFMSCTRFTAILFPAAMTLATVVKSQKIDQILRLTLIVIFSIATAMYICNQYMF